ncbi:MAG: hypothetical protein OXG72_00095 [Acidobacteria bacterium]|nr:hypothetical protein [Acidobacteriota bacterium]
MSQTDRETKSVSVSPEMAPGEARPTGRVLISIKIGEVGTDLALPFRAARWLHVRLGPVLEDIEEMDDTGRFKGWPPGEAEG